MLLRRGIVRRTFSDKRLEVGKIKSNTHGILAVAKKYVNFATDVYQGIKLAAEKVKRRQPIV